MDGRLRHMQTIQVLGKNILLKFRTWEHDGMIVIPEKSKPQPVEADVIAVGPGVDPAIEIGTKVIASRLAGTYVQYDGVKLCLMPESGILLIDDSEETNATTGK